MIRDAQSWLNDTLADAAGVAVTYWRGAESVPLTAWVGRTVFRQTPQQGAPGAQIIYGERDYLIPAASLILGAAPSVPAKGDRITEPGVGTFEAHSPGNEPLWRWADQTRTLIRVHTKRVS